MQASKRTLGGLSILSRWGLRDVDERTFISWSRLFGTPATWDGPDRAPPWSVGNNNFPFLLRHRGTMARSAEVSWKTEERNTAVGQYLRRIICTTGSVVCLPCVGCYLFLMSTAGKSEPVVFAVLFIFTHKARTTHPTTQSATICVAHKSNLVIIVMLMNA